jgi:hypothetical protein
MFEIVEAIATFFIHLMMIAISIMVLYHFWAFLVTLQRPTKPKKSKVTRKFPIPANQSVRFKKSFRSSKSIRR